MWAALGGGGGTRRLLQRTFQTLHVDLANLLAVLVVVIDVAGASAKENALAVGRPLHLQREPSTDHAMAPEALAVRLVHGSRGIDSQAIVPRARLRHQTTWSELETQSRLRPYLAQFHVEGLAPESLSIHLAHNDVTVVVSNADALA